VICRFVDEIDNVVIRDAAHSDNVVMLTSIPDKPAVFAGGDRPEFSACAAA
jgi:hypothetical protein